ncbi:MAG: phosphoethanolamine--lipid A transferase [Paraglaciecola sp.]|nr:phosphoethanolamine--lipid A transferase [Paraglaciecola sp.]
MYKIEFSYLLSKTYPLKDKLYKFKQAFTMSPFSLFFFSSVFMLLVANSVFFEKLNALYPWQSNLSFIISLTLLITCLNILLMLTLNLVVPAKALVVGLLLIAAMVNYHAVVLGVLVDKGMIQNIVETNLDEAKDIINISLFYEIVFIAILPASLLLSVKIKPRTRLQTLGHQVTSMVAIMIMIPILIAPFSAQYTSFFRLHKPLRYYTNPLFPVYSAFEFLASNITFANDVGFITRAKNIQKTSTTIKPKLMIMVVGEAVRADHIALNGYPRDTTPNMSRQAGLVNFGNVSACGTSTAVSVPCMFSFSGRDDFDLSQAKNTQNVLDVLAHSGVKVSWRDNNSSSKGVANRLPYQSYRSSQSNTICDVECRDLGMLVNLQDYIDQHTQDTLIVLHQMGNHGPAYFKRYPKSFEFFTPSCQSAELSQCSQSEIINSYDNAIRYTDHFLAEIIELLQTNSAQYNTGMLYVSDHGESLGENGIYLHGLPYAFAPDSQIHVPIMSWFSAPYLDIEKTQTHKDQAYSHDAISSTLLSLFEVKANIDGGSTSTLFHFKSATNRSEDEK